MFWSEQAPAPAALPVPDGPLWVFGYGSLMWDPGFPAEAIEPAWVDGYARAFCVRSQGHRGTPEQPGLVVGLVPAELGPTSRCRGLLIKADDRHKASVLDYLWRREMDLADGYVPRQVTALCDDGRRIEALTFVVDLTHEAYAGRLTTEETAQRIAAAQGQRGSNRNYLERTLAELGRLGIEDPALSELGRRVANLA